MLDLFSNIPSEYIIYFLYGSAFLFLSFAIFIKDMKGSDLRLAGSLWLLALFGLTHGIHELIELYPLIEGDHLQIQQIFKVKLVSLGVLIVSFLFLLQFGLMLAFPLNGYRKKWSNVAPLLLALAWIAWMTAQGFSHGLRSLGSAEVVARYLVGLPASLVTAYGLGKYSREIRLLSASVSRHLKHAGIGFIVYGVLAGIFVNRLSLIELPFPIELLRGITAMAVTFFIIKALNVFDIETRKRIEQQARRLVQTEKLTSLGQLAAGIAHEINNPLANASLAVQMLHASVRAGNEDNVPAKLEEIEGYIDRASTIAKELLQFSRQKESEPVRVSINDVINGALILVKHNLKNIAVTPDLAPVRDVLGAPGKLEQVFINILSNSIEAMPAGGEIFIRSVQRDGHVQVTVSDTGHGIPKEHLSRVFDPFFTTKEVGAGTGLGLFICYGIITQLNGTIEVSSSKGRGTTITVKIPSTEAA